MGQGRYIALEGVEGCGKSTHAAILSTALDAVLTRETGGTSIGSRVRDLLHDPANIHLDPVAEALLIAGDRAQHRAEVIEPALTAGQHVVSDRSVWSSLAYQGFGRGLPLDTVRRVNDWALAGRWPDLVLLLDVDADEANRRIAERELDRFEREDSTFFERVADGFRTMAAAEPATWVTIDARRDRESSPPRSARSSKNGSACELIRRLGRGGGPAGGGARVDRGRGESGACLSVRRPHRQHQGRRRPSLRCVAGGPDGRP
jgi:dTMP kinase